MIKVARSAGFCMGVKRAIEKVLALRRSQRGPIHTDGPLIHNPQIVGLLARNGIRPLGESVGPGGGVVVIRAHGVSPQRREMLRGVGLPLCDATCPDVAKVQGIVARYARRGYEIVIVGDRGHAEVEGLLGYSAGRGKVVSSAGDAATITPGAKVCVVAQTTQDAELFKEMAERISSRASECVVFDTICRATKERQREASVLAAGVDAMVVVGGRNSANTSRLATICERAGAPVFAVESESELEGLDLAPFRRIGVTAGASTPRWVIERVAEKLAAERARRRPKAVRAAAALGRGFAKARLFTACAAASLYGGMSVLQGISPRADIASAVTCLIVGMCVAAQRRGGVAPVEKGIAAAAAVLALFSSAAAGPRVFASCAVLLATNLAYSAEGILRRTLGGVRSVPLRLMPALKIMYGAAQWAAAIALLPLTAAAGAPGRRAVIAFVYVFALACMRSLFLGLDGAHGDTILDGETILSEASLRSRRTVLGASLAALCAALFAAPLPVGLAGALAAPLAYAVLYFPLSRRRLVVSPAFTACLAEGQSIIAGAAVILWKLCGS